MSDIRQLKVTLELVAAVGTDLGEGPIWDDRTGTLVFVDSNLGRIYLFNPRSSALGCIETGEVIGAAIPRESGGFVASGRDGLLAVGDDGAVALIAAIEKDLPHRMNDAKCDSRGRLWSGTFSNSFEPNAGALYRVGADLQPFKALGEVFVSNGMGWSPDERTFYYVDTGKRAIDAFDYDIETGALSHRRRFADIPRSSGLPDGMAVDAEGCLWVAMYLGGAVQRFAPDGACLGAIALPVARVTSCNFGGANLDELYITTANQLIHDDGRPHEPNAGGTYRCKPGIGGLPSHRFAG